MGLELDLYFIATQGQYTTEDYDVPYSTPDGFIVIVEESIIKKGGTYKGDVPYQKPNKLIRIKVQKDGNIFEKEVILSNINLKVSSIREEDKNIYIDVRDIVTGEYNTITIKSSEYNI